MIGISPAYFLSKYGNDFTIQDLINDIPNLNRQGFGAFQVEITKREYLKDWNNQSLERLKRVCVYEQMRVSQVVAHFWIDDLSTKEGILHGLNQGEIEKLLWLVKELPYCEQLTIPFGRFVPDMSTVCDSIAYSNIIQNVADTLENLCILAEKQETYIALELQPGAIIQGVAGFCKMLSMVQNHPALTYNFDTGHAHATKDIVELIPARLGRRLIGTHLCDNDSQINASLTPGEGNIAWKAVIAGLKNNQYNGSFDLEIMCKRSEVDLKYAQGLRFISSLLKETSL